MASPVTKGEVSDAYLMTWYDEKELSLVSDVATKITVEVDLTGMGDWVKYRDFELTPGTEMNHRFPANYQAYWVRFSSSAPAQVTAWLDYR